MQQKTLDLSCTEIFVLDEADQMLDLGFVKPIRQIVSRIPAMRQNLFFSATMPTEIGKLAGELLKDPVKVSVTPQATTVQGIWRRFREKMTPMAMMRTRPIRPRRRSSSGSASVTESPPARRARR